jgi:hypothetical protein
MKNPSPGTIRPNTFPIHMKAFVLLLILHRFPIIYNKIIDLKFLIVVIIRATVLVEIVNSGKINAFIVALKISNDKIFNFMVKCTP